ncbi:acyl carrier protein [Streptomyces prunicolor]|jgi:acyl carrier protein|uniref:Acyl carrier protein n=1 Tax=Streptomyces prunicolor TaxID=67348 RepID=A0ABU4FVN4_9ACTN|nr:acyl carrier protein [Streptomyces prunicolor]MCX5236674.1 acyl carrier protein [Streptomyces prunicolor]MDV7224031.1 acyl carrier protein [Streptomyces prunicolor]
MATLAHQIVGILSDKLDLGEAITASTPFSDLELDSLVMVELSVILQRQYGVLVPEEELADARDVNDIVSLMEDRRTAAA